MSILDHFRPEERSFVDRVIEMTELVAERYQPRLTHFLDPREQFIIRAIAGQRSDVSVRFFGGYEEAERQRALIVPEYVEVSQDDFKVTLLSIGHKLNVEHRDVLGSLLGLGIKREMFGDILLTKELQQCIIADEIAGYILANLRSISRYKVIPETISLESMVVQQDQWVLKETTVSSLRLDVILSELLPFSRAKAVPLIKAGKVKVNWRVVDQPSTQLKEGDVLSVKGYGRFLFAQIEGTTKKDKFRVRLGKKSS